MPTCILPVANAILPKPLAVIPSVPISHPVVTTLDELNVPKPPSVALMVPLSSALDANKSPARFTLNALFSSVGPVPPDQKTLSVSSDAVFIPASSPSALSVETDIYPFKESREILPCATPPTVFTFDISLSVIFHPPIFPALAIILPLAASIVTELVPFATFKPSEFNAKPSPVKLPFELTAPLYIDAPAVDINMLPLNVPPLAVIFPSIAKVDPSHKR